MDRTFRKVLGLVAPAGMSPEEYVLRCSAVGVDASPSDAAYVEWLLRGAGEGTGDLYDEVGDLLCRMVESGRLLGFRRLSGGDDLAMAGVMADAVLWRNKSFKSGLFAAVLRAAPRGSETWKTARRLNRGFGFTEVCYFGDEDGSPL